MIFETERLVLREMTEDDAGALSAILKDPEVMYAYGHDFTDGDVREWLDRQRLRYARYGFGLWAVILKATGALIGQCGLTWQEAGDFGRVLEVGYIFNRAYWHRGCAAEAARACRDHAFSKLGAREVFSIIRVGNTASENVARRNGMTPRGGLNKHYYGMDMPHTIFSVRAEELSRGPDTP